MSDRQLLANRANAKKSTGPVTSNGKGSASRNATRHGLLSSRLFLEGEDPNEFDALQIELKASLNPVGAIELSLVERIAINMWRQRRLVAAETAELQLSRENTQIAASVTSELNFGFANELKEDDLQPFDQDQVQWCKAVMNEIDRLEDIDLRTIKRNAPHVYGQLESDAKEDHETPETYLNDYKGGLTSYVAELYCFCRKQLEDAARRPHILKIVDLVRAKRLVLPSATLELFARYQTTLDNQIYKALKALREAQEWRLKTLDVEPSSLHPTSADANGFVSQ